MQTSTFENLHEFGQYPKPRTLAKTVSHDMFQATLGPPETRSQGEAVVDHRTPPLTSAQGGSHTLQRACPAHTFLANSNPPEVSV